MYTTQLAFTLCRRECRKPDTHTHTHTHSFLVLLDYLFVFSLFVVAVVVVVGITENLSQTLGAWRPPKY